MTPDEAISFLHAKIGNLGTRDPKDYGSWISGQECLDLIEMIRATVEALDSYRKSANDLAKRCMDAEDRALRLEERVRKSNDLELLALRERDELRRVMRRIALATDIDADAADGVTVAQVLQKEARQVLGIEPPTCPGCGCAEGERHRRSCTWGRPFCHHCGLAFDDCVCAFPSGEALAADGGREPGTDGGREPGA